MTSTLDRNLALELVRVTEAAAIAASQWVGRGDKIAADKAAVDAMRGMLNSVAMDGLVVIGEGEKDEAPMLFNGERIGDGSPPAVDIAVDPLEGTTLTAKGMPNALCVIAIAERGAMFNPGPCVYMEKMAGGPDIADLLSLDDPIETVLDRIAQRRGCAVNDIVVVLLERERHAAHIQRVRTHGGRIRLIPDGDVAGSLMAVWPETGVDLLWGVGGTPEGVLSAAAIKAIGGGMLGRMWPRDAAERDRTIAAGIDPDRVLTSDELCGGNNCFFAATGVTEGEILRGVRLVRGETRTQSIVMRSLTGTVRIIDGWHRRGGVAARAGS